MMKKKRSMEDTEWRERKERSEENNTRSSNVNKILGSNVAVRGGSFFHIHAVAVAAICLQIQCVHKWKTRST